MELLAWIILGLIVGLVAGLIMKGSGYGIVGDIVVGIVGALIGGWISSALTGRGVTNNFFDPINLLIALIGAIILIAILRFFSAGRARV